MKISWDETALTDFGDATAFRAFELHGFRISYYTKPDELVIIRFRHTKQQPLSY